MDEHGYRDREGNRGQDQGKQRAVEIQPRDSPVDRDDLRLQRNRQPEQEQSIDPIEQPTVSAADGVGGHERDDHYGGSIAPASCA